MADDRNFDAHRPHPWHGLAIGDGAPDVVTVHIEMTPSDSVKYEIDKKTGYVTVDRPREFSSQLPCAYGFIPRTYCEDRVQQLAEGADEGDLDPLDICVISDCPIERSDIILNARIVGGLCMIDHGEADDKIIAVLEGDEVWGDARDIGDIPTSTIDRIHHYFLTYKRAPRGGGGEVLIEDVYGADRARKVLQASIEDYRANFG